LHLEYRAACENLLVQRIARAHGFQRSGRIIRDRVMSLAETRNFIETEADGGKFIWMNSSTRSAGCSSRCPANTEDIRQIEDISLAELGPVCRRLNPAEAARFFGIRRLSSTARARMEEAGKSIA
jgi:hypothetical protein